MASSSTPRAPAPAAPAEAGIAALDSISEGFIVLDRDWRCVFMNPAAEQFTRRSRAEMLGRSLWESFPEAGDRLFGREYRRAVAENVPVQFEEFYPEPLNAWFEVRAYPSPEGLSISFRDISERRKIEEALRQSEERYRSLFNTMAQGFALFDVVCDEHGVPRESRFLDVNPAFERMIGLTRDEVRGRRGRDVFPDAYEQWADVHRRVVQSGEAVTFRHVRSGDRRQYEVFAFRPAPGRFAILFNDVTEQRRLEEELRVNLTKYKVLFEAIPVGISVTDADGQVMEINPVASRVLGTVPESVVGQRIGRPEWRIIRPDGSPMPPEELASVRAMKEQRNVEGVETGVARPGEDVIWLNVSAAPVPLDGYGVVIIYADVTRRKQAEERLEAAHREALAANARFEATMDALPIGLAISDVDGRIVRLNSEFERLWGPDRGGTSSLADYHQYKARWADTGRDLLHEEWASHSAVRSGELVIGQLLEVERFDGSRAFVLNSAAPIRDEAGTIVGCAVAVQDISRLVETERALARSEEDLRDANVHLEVANAALRRSNQTLEERVDARTQDLTRRTAQLQALALDLTRAEERERQRVAEVIHDHLQQLLSVARINLAVALEQATADPVRRSLADLDRALAESLDITRTLTVEISPAILRRSGLAAALRWLGRWYQGQFGLEVAVEIGSEVEPDAETRVTLFRAARELLYNVVKHARVTRASVQLSRTVDGRARIIVSDDGAGIDPELLRAWDGSEEGFGLFSLRERLDALGGQFEVQSAPGRGASITISGPPRGIVTPGTPPAGAPLKKAARKRAGERSRRKPSRQKP